MPLKRSWLTYGPELIKLLRRCWLTGSVFTLAVTTGRPAQCMQDISSSWGLKPRLCLSCHCCLFVWQLWLIFHWNNKSTNIFYYTLYVIFTRGGQSVKKLHCSAIKCCSYGPISDNKYANTDSSVIGQYQLITSVRALYSWGKHPTLLLSCSPARR